MERRQVFWMGCKGLQRESRGRWAGREVLVVQMEDDMNRGWAESLVGMDTAHRGP